MAEFTYFPDGQMDRMAGLLWQLAQELYVTRRRVAVLEQLLVQAGQLGPGAVDGHRPSGPDAERLRADGDAYLERLLRTVSERDDHRAPLREQFVRKLSGAGP